MSAPGPGAPSPGPATAITWAVYEVTGRRRSGVARVVCEQSEWDAMGQIRPGRFTLIRGGISNEADAERLARGTAGDRVRHGVPRR